MVVATTTFMPFTLTGSVTVLTGAGFPRYRPAAGLGVPGRASGPGQGQPAGAVAGPDRLRGHCPDAEPADLHWRGGARRFRSAEDFRVTTGGRERGRRDAGHRHVGRALMNGPTLLDVRCLSVSFGRARPPSRGGATSISFHVGKPARPWGIVGESRARASRSPRFRSCGCCPIPWPAIPPGSHPLPAARICC